MLHSYFINFNCNLWNRDEVALTTHQKNYSDCNIDCNIDCEGYANVVRERCTDVDWEGYTDVDRDGCTLDTIVMNGHGFITLSCWEVKFYICSIR